MLKRASQSPIRSKSNKKYQKDIKKKQVKQHTIHNEDKLKVFIKFKPINRYQNQNIQQLKYIDQKSIQIKTPIKNKIYQFDHVFNGYQNHHEVFEIGCKQLIDSVFIQTYEHNLGNHGLIFVYGNTGTGKTYSMGLLNSINIDSEGIVPDSLKYIFEMKRKKCFQAFYISISFSQIYMDQVYDLLDFQSEAKLTIRQDSKSRQPYIQNQTVIDVKNAEQAFQIINIGLQKRKVAEQKMNRKSSRGHGLITINIIPSGNERPGKICFIDLAGCQRLKDSQSKGTVLTEALHINSSLSCLQTLLMNISDQNIRNYRSSKLTRILQPYIQSGKINLFVTTNYENINAIQFAKRCKGIKFLEKQIKASITPTKRSKVTIADNTISKITKQLEDLYLFKKESIQKQKKYTSCITNLINIINKLSYEMQHIVKNQTLHNQYSFSEIFNNADIQKKINQKIRQYQGKEALIIQKIIQKIDRNNGCQLDFTQLIHNIGNSHEFMKYTNEKSCEIINSLKQFGKFSEYKNIYKKQFFTSEFKVYLLQKKCLKYEDSIYYLMKYMNTTDKRVIRRLKELNISLNKQNLQNNPHLKNKKTPSKSIQKSQCIVKQFIHEQPSFDISQRRNAIYIDEF